MEVVKNHEEFEVCEWCNEKKMFTGFLKSQFLVKPLPQFEPHPECDKNLAIKNREVWKEQEKQNMRASYYDELFTKNEFLPNDLINKTFENYKTNAENEKTIQQIKKAWKLGTTGLTLLGPSGTGKTHLLCAIINEIANYTLSNINYENRDFYSQRDIPKFLTVGQFAMGMRYSKYEDAESFFNKQKRASVLFIDDLGIESSTDFIREALFTLIDYRLANELKTFISTNLSLKEIKEKYHERFLSRLKEMTLIFEIKGDDFRTKIIAEKYKQLGGL